MEKMEYVQKMPKDCFYFEPENPPLAKAETIADIEKNIKYIKNFDLPYYLEEDFSVIGEKAKSLNENTDYALMGNFAIHVFAGGCLLRGFEQFMIDLILNRKIAECIMENLVSTYIGGYNKCE